MSSTMKRTYFVILLVASCLLSLGFGDVPKDSSSICAGVATMYDWTPWVNIQGHTFFSYKPTRCEGGFLYGQGKYRFKNETTATGWLKFQIEYVNCSGELVKEWLEVDQKVSGVQEKAGWTFNGPTISRIVTSTIQVKKY